jgi:hypothetical protein
MIKRHHVDSLYPTEPKASPFYDVYPSLEARRPKRKICRKNAVLHLWNNKTTNL